MNERSWLRRRWVLRTLAAVALASAAVAEPPPEAPVPDAPVQDRVDRERLMETLRQIALPRAAAGPFEEQMGLMRVEALVRGQLAAAGYEPRMQPIWWNAEREARRRARGAGDGEAEAPGPAGGAGPPGPPPEDRDTPEPPAPPRERGVPGSEPNTLVWHNVIAELPGRERPREVLIVGAHFDAVPGSPGADDNGTGVAALLELARVLKDRPMRRTVRFVFFNAEEPGLRGSSEHVASLQDRLAPAGDGEVGPEPERVVAMISLEMLGYFSDEPGSQRSPVPPIDGVFDPPNVGDFVAIVTTSAHRALARRLDQQMRRAEPALKTLVADFFPPLPATPPDVLRSDHAPFLAAGVPAVMVTDTANHRNPHYHRPTDTVETIDAERFAGVVRGLAGAVEALAEPAGAGPNEKGRSPGEEGRGPDE